MNPSFFLLKYEMLSAKTCRNFLKDYITYILLINNREDKKLNIGSLGNLEFKEGYYSYVGSAKKNLAARINRHFSINKKSFWHIDYFLKDESVCIKKVWVAKLPECHTAKIVSYCGKSINRFGASDCSCRSHLFYLGNANNIWSDKFDA